MTDIRMKIIYIIRELKISFPKSPPPPLPREVVGSLGIFQAPQSASSFKSAILLFLHYVESTLKTNEDRKNMNDLWM